MATPVNINDEKALLNVALTSMGSKGLTGAKEHFARLAVDAVKLVTEERDGKPKADIDLIKIIKKHGKSLEDTELVRGMVIDKEVASSQMPKDIHDAKIALLNTKLEIDKTEFDAKINIERPEQMQLFLDEEERMLKEMVDQVRSTGANVLFCEKGIDDLALHFLAKAGILAVKSVAAATGETRPSDRCKLVASIKTSQPMR
jgi:chaperonin GroEL (HSP60 family)